jgi:hypothetical protein
MYSSVRECPPCAFYSAYTQRHGGEGHLDVIKSLGVICLDGYAPVDSKIRFKTKSLREINSAVKGLVKEVWREADSPDDHMTITNYEVASKKV